MADTQPFTSWVSRVKLLDDFPIQGDPTSDMLGLSLMAESTARSFIESDGMPIVIHCRPKSYRCHRQHRILQSCPFTARAAT